MLCNLRTLEPRPKPFMTTPFHSRGVGSTPSHFSPAIPMPRPSHVVGPTRVLGWTRGDSEPHLGLVQERAARAEGGAEWRVTVRGNVDFVLLLLLQYARAGYNTSIG